MPSEIPGKLISNGFALHKQFNPGGQSETFLISKDEELFLLKKPLSQSLSKEQKFRFQQEAEALKLIDGRGAPKVFDYFFDNEPYILMEFIQGKTLTDIVNGKPLETNKSLNILFQVLNILKDIHNIGLLHRDIKPDNIVINENGEVYLIDFGLCRIDNINRTYNTPSAKELGNRFLRLPEFGKGEKISSSVSDITFVVGLLFFMLSGKAPHILLDEYGQYPQQRHLLKEEFLSLNWVRYTFDKGFSYQVSQRFQSAEELISFLHELIYTNNNMHEDNPIDELTRLLNSNEYKRKDEIIELLHTAQREFIEGINNSIGTNLVAGGSGPNIGQSDYEVVTTFFIHRQNRPWPIIHNLNIISTLDKDLSTVTYYSKFPDQQTLFGSNSPTEIEKILFDYKNIGEIRGKQAVRKLIELLKDKE